MRVLWVMFCSICHKGNVDFSTDCGHHYHLECFPTNQSHLPCVVCHQTLGRACYDANTNTWMVGVKTGEHFCSCYKLVGSQMVPHRKVLTRWCRDNGRLQKRKSIPIKNNICVT